MNFSLNFTLLSSVFTVVSLVVFLGIMYWAFSGANKAKFDALAHLPLEPDEVSNLPPDQAKPTYSGA